MGGGSWSSQSWSNYSQTNVSGKTQSQVFSSNQLDEGLDPKKFTNGIRESVDSADNPLSTPVAIFTDVTGSMGRTAEAVIRKLDVVCQELLDRAPVTDVHLLTGAIGDAYTDRSAFQATQFEADIRIAEQTQKIYIEGNGGGNGGESYALAWLFAALQTATDSFDKRGKKGYLFTVGDEPVHGVEGSGQGQAYGVTKAQAAQFLGLTIERDLTADECLAMARRKFNVMHISISSHGAYRAGVNATFGKIMPDDLYWLEDVNVLPELIVSLIEVSEGRDKAAVAASWNGSTSVAVANALNTAVSTVNSSQEVVRL